MHKELPGKGHPYDENKRVARILEIVQMISLNPRRYLRRDLAERFNIGERMIQKDLDIIRHGLKLSLAHSPKGYYLQEMPQLPSLQYTLTEALALFLSVQAGQRISGMASPDLAAAVARLGALFPPSFKKLLDLLNDRSAMSVQGEHRHQMLMLLNRAWMEQRKISMTYKTQSRQGAVSERVVCTYYVMPHVRSWHLIAYCEWRNKILMFKVDRILKVTLLDDHYIIPKDFRPEEYMGHVWGMMRGEEGVEPVEVVLLFEPEAGCWVAEENWHPSQQAEERPDGSVLFRLSMVITPEFMNWLLYYGSRVEVIEPVWLRKQVAEEHLKAAQLYGCPAL